VAELSGFFPAADGWVRLHGNYPHHAAAIEQSLGAGRREDVVRAVAGLAAQEVEDRIVAAGGVAAVVRTEQAWAAHPHGRATHHDPWCTTTPGDERRRPRAAGLPLAGVRVLDLTRVIAGPTCSQVLACLGADVLRVDPPQRPELRDQYLSNGMGKRSAEVDLGSVGNRLHTDVLPYADVVLLGYRPGSLSRYGLEVDALRAQHPGLVVATLSAWGEHGPWGRRSGFDSIVQAATGIAQACAGPDGRPGALPVQALDHSTGYVLATEVMTLLADSRGGAVQVNLLGAARSLLARPRRPAGEDPVVLDVPRVVVRSPYGTLSTVPPAILLDGRRLGREVLGYGSAELAWL